MVITLDKVAKEVAQRVGDRNNERLKEIKSYVQDIVTELTMLLKGGGVYQTATLSVTNGQATLPDDVVAVLRIYDTSTTVYESVDNTEYRTRESQSSTLPTVQVFEQSPNWRIELLNYGTSNTLRVDYLIASSNPAILPNYYFYLLVAGAESRYHARRSTPEKYGIAKTEYKEWKDRFLENNVYNGNVDRRIKSLREIDISQPSNSMFVSVRNDYMSPGGY